MVDAVITWFNTHTGWLLILDNVNDISMLEAALFKRTSIALQYGKGHLLLTTRSQAVGTYIKKIEITQLNAEQGADFLLRRAKGHHASEANHNTAKAISVAMDGLPLALDQAGAYLEETGCRLSDYLEMYNNKKERALLLKRRGKFASDHPEFVAATFALSYDKVQRDSPLAADILCACAFLYPENIPEDIILNGASELSSSLQEVADKPHEINEAFASLFSYSLVLRDTENHMLSIHRLVQAVIQDTLNENEQRQWAERAIRAVNQTFPEIEYTTWTLCQQYLPHALACDAFINQWNIHILEAANLLHKIGDYMYDRAQYREAEPLYQEALRIKQKVLAPEHPSTAATMHALARLYQAQGRYGEAEPLYKEALRIYQEVLPEHPNTKLMQKNVTSFLEKKRRKN